MNNTTQNYTKYSDSQIEEARNVDIVNFLQRYEGFNFKPAGHFFKGIEHDSLMVRPDRKGWYWNSKAVGGANAIDYLCKIHGLSFAAACGVILNQSGELHIAYKQASATAAKKDEPKVIELPKKTDGRFDRVFAYLTSRYILPQIVSSMMKEHKIYQDARGNAVFVGFNNENNKPAYAAVRGTFTNVKFRGDVAGSDKRYGFAMSAADTAAAKANNDTIYVFESSIDAMSHATIAALVIGDDTAWQQHNRLALGGTSDNALEHYLEVNSNVKKIVLCLDNDEAGKINADKYIQKYREKGYDVRYRPPSCKDYNEDLAVFAGLNSAKIKEIVKWKSAQQR